MGNVIGRVLLLTPSRGLGGGIERYVETLEWAFAQREVEYARVDLHSQDRAGRASAHVRTLVHCRSQLRASMVPTQLVVAHRALLPIASLLAREQHVRGLSVICHGTDVWGARPRLRRAFETHLMRTPGVRVIAVSSFTAGALAETCPAAILPPGLSRDWFRSLIHASEGPPEPGEGVELLTAFRLEGWVGKGLPQLLRAVAALGRPDIHLTVCGSGEPPPELRSLVLKHPFCRLLPNLTDDELADQLAAADLFVLATRTKGGRNPSGEGFGLVLLEAQVAGTPVVGPAAGGSADAYVDQITGVAPADETSESLARILNELLKDPSRLAQMGRRAAEWARGSFAPEHYASRVAERLL